MIDPIPILTDNYVWALSNGSVAIIVDPGESASVATWLHEHGLQLVAILITHHHHDHMGGLSDLCREWPDARSTGPRDDRIDGLHCRVGNGDRIGLGAGMPAFGVIEIPGHTSTHIAYHGNGLLFCGDTLFSAGCGRLFEGTPAQMLSSLDALAALPGDSLVCCGHEYTAANCAFAVEVDPGNRELRRYRDEVAELRAAGKPTLPGTLSNECAVNPFLRIDASGIRDTLIRKRSLDPAASRVDTFATLRAWKDEYRA